MNRKCCCRHMKEGFYFAWRHRSAWCHVEHSIFRNSIPWKHYTQADDSLRFCFRAQGWPHRCFYNDSIWSSIASGICRQCVKKCENMELTLGRKCAQVNCIYRQLAEHYDARREEKKQAYFTQLTRTNVIYSGWMHIETVVHYSARRKRELELITRKEENCNWRNSFLWSNC
jgi:hypothetical protein